MNSKLRYAYANSSTVFGFLGDFEFLALNFPVEVTYKGHKFPSAGNAFHAAKCPVEAHFLKFKDIDPYKANEASVGLPTFANWASMREAEMKTIIREKFSNVEMKAKLLATGTKKLVNANHWGDTFWGTSEAGEGHNKLGLLLEEVRGEFAALERQATYTEKSTSETIKENKFGIRNIIKKGK